MSARSKIEWTNATWNPIRARNKETGGVGHFCVHVSPGCANCYAERMQKRFNNPIRYAAQDREKVEIFLDNDVLTAPLRWRKPRMIFVCSMTDLFEDGHPDGWIDSVFAVMALCPQNKFQVLTKRAKRMRGYMTNLGRNRARWQTDHQRIPYAIDDTLGGREPPWPLPNVWLGVSVEDQEHANERIPDLLATPAAVRFVSVEPMLGPVDLHLGRLRATPRENDAPADLHRASDNTLWLICGGESGPGARPFDLQWARQIIAQCKAANVPVFMKQIGARPQGEWKPGLGFIPPGDPWWTRGDRKGGSPDEWPEDLRVREFPK